MVHARKRKVVRPLFRVRTIGAKYKISPELPQNISQKLIDKLRAQQSILPRQNPAEDHQTINPSVKKVHPLTTSNISPTKTGENTISKLRL